MKSTLEELNCWDREIVWHAFTQMAEYEPLLVDRAHGCTLVDVKGRELLDGVSSLWCNLHGHRHPRLDAAIREQLDRVAHVTSLGCSMVLIASVVLLPCLLTVFHRRLLDRG